MRCRPICRSPRPTAPRRWYRAQTLSITATVVSHAAQTNTAAISHADQFDPNTVNNTASATETPQQVSLVKFVNGQDADSPTGPHVAAGSTVTFTYVVTNTGNVPLANVVVSDDKLGTDHRLHRRHQRQRPARPDRDLDLHHDRHRPGRPADQRRHRHRPGRQQPARHDGHRRQPGQLLRRRPGDQHRQVRQRPGRRQPDRAARGRRQHRDLHLRGDQHRQRPAGQRRRQRRQAGADHRLHRRHQRQRPARPDRDLDLHDRPPPPWPASRPTPAPSPPRTPTTRPARRSPTTTRPTTSATPRHPAADKRFQRRRQGRYSLAERQRLAGDLDHGRHQRSPVERSCPILGLRGMSLQRPISTATARPIFFGRTTAACRRSGPWTAPTITGGAVLPDPGPTWHVAAAADFNGDGKSDILWQNDSGLPAIWTMDGTTITGGAAPA